MSRASTALHYLGAAEVAIGAFLFILMSWSFYDARAVLGALFGEDALRNETLFGVLSENSWKQTAVAFGMHAFADMYNGLEQMARTSGGVVTRLPKTVTGWNTCRFYISFLWLTFLVQHKIAVPSPRDPFAWPLLAKVLCAVLAFDSILLRPLAVWNQRALADAAPPLAKEEATEWAGFSPLQRVCRCVFYYEAVLSGTSGIVYAMQPNLFLRLFGVHNQDSTGLTNASLAQFGALVSAFGLYQMNADIDTRTGMVAWWLALDIVWLFVFWQGITQTTGYWNPFTAALGGEGSTSIFPHLAFHADSTLALARTVFLYTVYTRGRATKSAAKGAAPHQEATAAIADEPDSKARGRAISRRK